MPVDPNLLSKILNHLDSMIRSRDELVSWMEEFISDIKAQEIAINSVNAGAAVLGVVSFFGLFTPFAPLAIGGMVAAGGTSVAITIGDVIKGGKLGGKIESMKKDDSKLEELQNQLDVQAEELVKELDITKENAVLFLLVGVPKAVAQGGVQVVKGSVEIIKILPHLKAARDAMKLGAPLMQAFKLSNTAFQGAGRLSVVGAAQAARVGTTLVVTTATKVLGGLGAVIGIADAVYRWNNGNPNRASAEKLLPQLQENVKGLKQMKKKFSELNK